jgi:hypothetical protein
MSSTFKNLNFKKLSRYALSLTLAAVIVTSSLGLMRSNASQNKNAQADTVTIQDSSSSSSISFVENKSSQSSDLISSATEGKESNINPSQAESISSELKINSVTNITPNNSKVESENVKSTEPTKESVKLENGKELSIITGSAKFGNIGISFAKGTEVSAKIPEPSGLQQAINVVARTFGIKNTTTQNTSYTQTNINLQRI